MITDEKSTSMMYEDAQQLSELTQLKLKDACHLYRLLRMMIVHPIVEQSLESSDGKPDDYQTMIPLIGELSIHRKSSGTYEYSFNPSEEFNRLVTKAIEKGVSPMEGAALEAAKRNLSNRYKEMI